MPLVPVTAAALGWVLLGQTFTGLQAAGFGLALVASVMGQLWGTSRVRRPRADP